MKKYINAMLKIIFIYEKIKRYHAKKYVLCTLHTYIRYIRSTLSTESFIYKSVYKCDTTRYR